MPSHRRSSVLRRVAAAICLATFASACAVRSPILRTDGAVVLRERNPAPYRLAVAPLRLATGVAPLPLSVEFLRDRLVADLRVVRAASTVVTVGNADLAEADTAGADLLVRPLVTAARFEHVGTTPNALLSSLLWVTTWVGGLLVEDTDYHARLQVDWEIVNPHTGQVVDRFVGGAAAVRLAFLDRHAFWSGGTLLSLVVPPFLSGDDRTRTDATLCDLAVAKAATDFAAYLKDGLGGVERELLGIVRLEHPHDGRVPVGRCRPRGRVLARDLVAELHVRWNGRTVAELSGDGLPPRSAQQLGPDAYAIDLPDLDLAVGAGTHELSIEFTVAGRRSSRTFVVVAEES
jgi:hypothetical protein